MHHSLSPTNLQAKAIAPRLRLTTKFTVNVASSDSTNTQKFIIMRFLSMRSLARLIRMYTWSKPGLIHYSLLTGLMPIPCDMHKKNLQFGNGKNKKKIQNVFSFLFGQDGTVCALLPSTFWVRPSRGNAGLLKRKPLICKSLIVRMISLG